MTGLTALGVLVILLALAVFGWAATKRRALSGDELRRVARWLWKG